MENKLLILLISLFTFGFTSAAGIMKKESLTEKEQKIVMISAFTAGGNLEKLNKALNEGLDAGLTINEIKAVIILGALIVTKPTPIKINRDAPKTAIISI